MGRRAAVRRRDRRLGRALRAVSELTPQGRYAEIAREDGRGALVTILEGPGAGAKMLVEPDGSRRGSLGVARARRRGRAPRRRAHVVRALRAAAANAVRRRDLPGAAADHLRRHRLRRAAVHARRARAAGGPTWSTRAGSSRGRTASPTPRRSSPRGREEAFERIGGIDRATSIAVLTHDPKLDDAALGIALRSDAAYVGAMGSRRAQEKRRERLRRPGPHRRGDRAAERADRPRPRCAHRPRRPRCRSWARSSPIARGREGGRLSHLRGGRIHEVTA